MLLNINNLEVQFGGLKAVDKMNLEVAQGEIVGLIGPNGAGKSTLLNAISRLVSATGSILLDRGMGASVDLLHMTPSKIVQYGITRTFQHPQVAPELTVGDNIGLGLFTHVQATWLESALGLPRSQRASRMTREQSQSIARFLRIDHLLDELPAALPYGTLKLVELARAAVGSPVLMVLDEPAAGLNSEEKQVMKRSLLSLRQEKSLSILIVDHDMEFIFGISERIYAMSFGKLLASGTAAEIRGNREVQESYLGQEDVD